MSELHLATDRFAMSPYQTSLSRVSPFSRHSSAPGIANVQSENCLWKNRIDVFPLPKNRADISPMINSIVKETRNVSALGKGFESPNTFTERLSVGFGIPHPIMTPHSSMISPSRQFRRVLTSVEKNVISIGKLVPKTPTSGVILARRKFSSLPYSSLSPSRVTSPKTKPERKKPNFNEEYKSKIAYVLQKNNIVLLWKRNNVCV